MEFGWRNGERESSAAFAGGVVPGSDFRSEHTGRDRVESGGKFGGGTLKSILLIAINFVREQRWPIFVLLLWVLLLAFLGLVANFARQREDLLFIFKQVAVYRGAFSVFFGGSAIYNERKSRRILAVLSKAVARRQYLSGLVLGVTIACGIYCFSLGITASWTLGQSGFPISQVWFLMASLTVACMLAGTVALMFSTFLNPFFAARATAVVLGLPGWPVS